MGDESTRWRGKLSTPGHGSETGTTRGNMVRGATQELDRGVIETSGVRESEWAHSRYNVDVKTLKPWLEKWVPKRTPQLTDGGHTPT